MATSDRVLVRFLAYHRIKPHNPPLVRAPVNSFEFHSCERTPQRGLPGYLILFATHAFVPQRQLYLGNLPSQLLPQIYSRLTVSMAVLSPPTDPLNPINPDNACTLRITAAAGTELAGAYSYSTFSYPHEGRFIPIQKKFTIHRTLILHAGWLESGPCLSTSVGDHPLRPPKDHRLGEPLPHQLANLARAHLYPPELSISIDAN
ncbi:hypothetical protein Lal_00042773 [Lupinus albus]|nr:hypothetical protein Lal_00042773 [Lupinus albus]